MGLLVTLKGLPLAYNRDLQEDKEPLFDLVETVLPCVRLMAGVLENLRLKEDNLARALQGGFLTATDMADYLVTKGVPFRTAHSQVGQTVRYAEAQGKELAELTLEEIREFAPLAEADLFEWLQSGTVGEPAPLPRRHCRRKGGRGLAGGGAGIGVSDLIRFPVSGFGKKYV